MSYLWSLLLIAAGAILRYAVDADLWASVNEDIVGMILMIIGAIGFFFTLLIVALVGGTTRAIRDMNKDNFSVPRQKPLRIQNRKGTRDW